MPSGGLSDADAPWSDRDRRGHRGRRVPAGGTSQQQGPPEDQLPRFAPSAQLLPPVGWEAWVMVGSSTGLSYSAAPPPAAGAAPGMFHNVYVQPWAYREFDRTGAFPERTMLVLAFYEASRKSAPARAGFYEGDRLGAIEVHLKQAGIDKTGWGFFGFGDGAATAALIPTAAPCYSCHATEAAHDQVFTQFYPPLRERLARASAH